MRHGATCWRLSVRPMNAQCISRCWRAARLHLMGMVSLLAALALSCHLYHRKLYQACWGHPARPVSAHRIMLQGRQAATDGYSPSLQVFSDSP